MILDQRPATCTFRTKLEGCFTYPPSVSYLFPNPHLRDLRTLRPLFLLSRHPSPKEEETETETESES